MISAETNDLNPTATVKFIGDVKCDSFDVSVAVVCSRLELFKTSMITTRMQRLFFIEVDTCRFDPAATCAFFNWLHNYDDEMLKKVSTSSVVVCILTVGPFVRSESLPLV